MVQKYMHFIDYIHSIKEKIRPYIEKVLKYLEEVEEYESNSYVISSINEVISLIYVLLMGLGTFIVLNSVLIVSVYYILIPVM